MNGHTTSSLRLCEDSVGFRAWGARCFRTHTQSPSPPFPDPPEFSGPSFGNFRLWLGAWVPKALKFFEDVRQGYKCFFTLRVHTQSAMGGGAGL